jgi:pimeloyl-ACP methyl ester carboxylesterase
MAILAGCGDDGGSTPPDAAVPDAIQAPDASETPPDASVPTFDKTKKTQELSTGITMAYVETGNPSGEVVILIHGYTDSMFTLFTTMEGFAASVIAFMDAKSIATAHIVGHSMGGFVAQELALAHPDRLASLTLTGTLVYAPDNPAAQDFLIRQVEETWRSALEATPGFQFPQDAYDLTPMAADPDIVNWVANNWITDKAAASDLIADIVVASAETKLGTWIGALRDFSTFDTTQRLEALTVRTLVMWGIQDEAMPEDPDQARLRAALDLAIEACNLDYYFFKTYGKAPRPPAGSPLTDLSHSFMRAAGESMAADITAWVTTGEPTTDLTYSDPANIKTMLVDEGAAEIIEKRKPETCP